SVRRQAVKFMDMLRALDRPRRILLLGYLMISDCVSAIILFASIYGSNVLHLSDRTIGSWLLGIQLLAFPNTYLVSSLTRPLGTVRTLGICVLIWVTVIFLMITQTHPGIFGVVAVLT